ncbi:hypothetical protein GE061_015995, partial [Apolygus lucorum]
YQSILKYYVQENDHQSLLGCCRRFEHQEPGLWVQALWELKSNNTLKEDVLSEILSAIERGSLMSPLLVIDALSQSPNFEAGHLKPYLKKVLQTELDLKAEQHEKISAYNKEIQEIQTSIDELAGRPIKFQASRCCICNKQLEHPSVHFFCQHSFHQHCFQSFADNENECPPCMGTNKQVIEAFKSQEENKDLHEMFHRQLEHAEDGFSLVTDYLGRGVFTKLTNYGEVAMRAETLRTRIDPKPASNTSSAYSSRHQTLKDEVVALQHDNSLYANISRKAESTNLTTYGSYKTSHNKPSEPPLSERITTTVANSKKQAGSNPFGEDEEEDEGVYNPFSDNDDAHNPFGGDADDEYGESDDYDKNLNPFA